MKTDKNIKEKLANRAIEPSASAWERLSVQLDEQPKAKKKGWFFYIGAVASILLLFSIGIQLFSNDSEEIKLHKTIVNNPLDTISINKKIDKTFNEILVEEVIVKTERVEEKQKNEINTTKNVIAKRSKTVILKNEKSFFNTQISLSKITRNNKIEITKVEKKNQNIITKNEKSITNKLLKQDPNSPIKINSDDLLFAVTHSPQEVQKYYAKYNINREDVLKTIQNQLKESNFKINPETILAEVERTIDDDDFQNNFMKLLKRKVSDIASVIVSRND